MERLNELKSVEAAASTKLKRCQDSVEAARGAHGVISYELVELQKSGKDIGTERENARQRSAKMSSLGDHFGARGVQTFILQNTVKALQLSSQSYLDELSDETLRLQLELDTSDRILRNAAVLTPDGMWIERPLSSLSGLGCA
jgi:hypothetical protein